MCSQGSSQEMDQSESCSRETEGPSQNTVEMVSVPGSLDSNMDTSEPQEDGNEDGNEDENEDQEDQNKSRHNDSSGDECPPSQGHSPVSVKVSIEVASINLSQEVSSDDGSQEDNSCQITSPITVKLQAKTTKGSQEVSADKVNGSQDMDMSEFLENGDENGNGNQDDQKNSSNKDSNSDVPEEGPPPQGHSPISVKVSIDVVPTNLSQEVSSDDGSQEFKVNSETYITLVRKNSNEKWRNLKRKLESQDREECKEKNVK